MSHAFRKICQTILLKNQEKGVLLLRLKHNKKWELPGGRMDKGEEWLEGLRREVEEETGIKNFKITYFDDVDTWTHRGFPQYGTFFIGETKEKEITLSKDHDKYLWVKNEKDISKLNFAHPRLKKMCKEEFLKGKKEYGSYHVLARYYDSLMKSEKYVGWAELLKELIKKYDVHAGLALDVACGTGKMSKLISEEGFEVIGVDNSKEMLEVARDNYPSLKFKKNDMCDFQLERKDVVIAFSFYDSLNYLLTKKGLLGALKSVSENIAPSALFVFDINPLEKIKLCQKKPPQVFEKENYYCIFRNGGEDDLWILDIDFFIKKDSCFSLIKERHVERGYTEEEIRSLLRKTDLELLEVRKEKNKDSLSRLYFVVRKI